MKFKVEDKGDEVYFKLNESPHGEIEMVVRIKAETYPILKITKEGFLVPKEDIPKGIGLKVDEYGRIRKMDEFNPRNSERW